MASEAAGITRRDGTRTTSAAAAAVKRSYLIRNEQTTIQAIFFLWIFLGWVRSWSIPCKSALTANQVNSSRTFIRT
ncbi:hypothetical protein glysoja_012298 [Glycine soja]|nr:hypothetical protein glysoja_012298 [Glycine soja]